MKNYFYITGTSRGIGKSLAERILREENNVVIGISRTATINHKNYRHISLDLSDAKSVDKINFENHDNILSVTLINNSGALGEIMPVGKRDNICSEKLYTLNMVVPAMLMNKFIKNYGDKFFKKAILNISSGAAKNPIAGWSDYCASKAALEMYSRVVDEEQKEIKNGVKVLAIAPGVVDTQMQSEIRSSKKEFFPRFNDFWEYYTSNQLLNCDLVSEKIFLILLKIESIPGTVIALKDY